MSGKNEIDADLPETFERDDPFEHDEERNEEVARDREDDDWTGIRGWSKSDIGIVLEARYLLGSPVA